MADIPTVRQMFYGLSSPKIISLARSCHNFATGRKILLFDWVYGSFLDPFVFGPLQLRESVFAVVCDRAKNDLSILTIFRRFPSRDVISGVLSNVLLGITVLDAGRVDIIIEAGGTIRDMVITSHQTHTAALSLSLWTLTGSPSHMSSRTTDCDGVTCHVVTRSRGGHYITLHSNYRSGW